MAAGKAEKVAKAAKEVKEVKLESQRNQLNLSLPGPDFSSQSEESTDSSKAESQPEIELDQPLQCMQPLSSNI